MIAFLIRHQAALLIACNVIAIVTLIRMWAHRDPFVPPPRRRS